MAVERSQGTEQSETAPIAGSVIGAYRVVRKLGSGGMGAVYEAVNKQIGRRAAIKLLHAEYAARPDIVSRFLNEARAANLVHHPGIVDIYEYGQTPSGNAYIVMEYIDGVALTARLAQARTPLGLSALPMFQKMAQALAAAHDKGIVHRDLKPDNVMLMTDADAPGGERIKILDFGIAKLSDQALAAGGHDQDAPVDGKASTDPEYRTRTGALMGTPAYMAPEQCRGAERVTDRADVYSLGLMLYRALSGTAAFTARSDMEFLLLHTSAQPPNLREKFGIDNSLAQLVAAMLAKEPEQRPAMAEVATQLGQHATRLHASGLMSDSRAGAEPPSQSGLSGAPAAERPSTLGSAAFTLDRPGPSRALGLVVASSIALGVLAVSLFASLHKRPPPRELAPPRSTPVAATPASGVAPPLPAAMVTVPATAAASVRVHWEVSSTPTGALVIAAESNEVLGITPWRHEREAASGPFKIVLRLPSFQDTPLMLDRGRDAMVQLVLPPAEAGRPGRAPSRVRGGKPPPASSAKNLTNEDLPVVQ